MKIEVVTGQIYYGNKRAANPGDIIDLPDNEAERLINLGVAKVLGSPDPGPKKSNAAPPKTAEEIAAEAEADAKKAAEEAAKKRKKAEEAAVKKGLGTAEEIAALSDEDLQSLFKAKK